jgi:acyl-CoA thioester hydrolase
MEHVITIRVRYAETDRQRILYHAHYLTYFEVARTEMLRAAGVRYRDLEAAGCFLVVTEATCRYRSPAGYDDELRIATRVTDVSPVRIVFRYGVTQAEGGRVVAEGETTLACVDGTGRPRRLPPELSDRLGGGRVRPRLPARGGGGTVPAILRKH